MPTTIIGPLRWQEEPSSISISQNGEDLRTYYQVTAPREIAALCKGRPAEELPRIVSILSPSHHIASAKALDTLFGVKSPPTAENIREALRQALIFLHHSRKLLFLLSSSVNPPGGGDSLFKVQPQQRRTGDEIMRGIALFEEAAAILGGRYPHPVSAIAGGVSRPLKEVHLRRLQEIAKASLPYALRLRDIFVESVTSNACSEQMSLSFGPLASIASKEGENEITALDPPGSEPVRFTLETIAERLEIVTESWTYLPFVRMKAKTWEGPVFPETGGLFFVGPLARLNRCSRIETPLAEEERQRLIRTHGPQPHFSAIAGYWSMVIELIESAEKSESLFSEEMLSGSETRVVATGAGRHGLAAFEAPEGFIFHRYEVDERGLVEEATILDAASQNNGLRSLLVQKMVEEAVSHAQPWEQAKKAIELSLTPF